MESRNATIRRSLGILLLAFVAGCSPSGQPYADSQKNLNSSSSAGFTYETKEYYVQVPNDFADKQESDGMTFFGYADKSVTGDVFIKIANATDSCSPTITGASQMSKLTDAKALVSWGRVDRWDSHTGNEDIDIDDKLVLCQNNSVPRYQSVYALCSEKDGKTVVVCISQMTDNPKLAEDIFKTFKWTK